MSLSSLSSFVRVPKFRRAFALAAVVLATGGLVLAKAPSSSAYPGSSITTILPKVPLTADGKNAVAFSGPGVHGVVSLSHTKVLENDTTSVFAEIRVAADEQPMAGEVKRAPIALAIVLDTSGSMSGDKIEDAKRSVLRLVDSMRDDDWVSVVRYSDRSEIVQQLGPVGASRAAIREKVRGIRADGGTNIPEGLERGLATLDGTHDVVRRLVLVSDGLDSTRARAEQLARTSFSRGITISSLGIGLDFDESYMGAVAQNGHGNFAFVKDGGSLATFLKRELDEASTTTVENLRVRLRLPSTASVVSANGADIVRHGNGEVELALGSLFAGDERRVIVEMNTRPFAGEALLLQPTATFRRVGGESAVVDVPRLVLTTTTDRNEVERGRDGNVFASAMSVVSSRRQIEAANAYQSGDLDRASALTAQNESDLSAALAAAPATAAPSLQNQLNDYAEQKRVFKSVRPRSAEGNAAAKSAASKEMSNLTRKAW